MKKILVFISALIFLGLSRNLMAQDNPSIVYSYNIKLSYNGVFDFYEKFISEPNNYYRIEGNYRILPYLDVGVQGFYARQRAITAIFEGKEYLGGEDYGVRPRIGLGLNSNFYPIPLIFDKVPHWIEPYISAKWSYSHLFYPELNNNEIKQVLVNHRYGVYGGLNLYLGKYFGFYAEFGRSNIENYKNLNTYVGITIKF